MNPVRIIVNGSKGRMGQTILACAKEDCGLEITHQIDIGEDLDSVITNCDGIIDFSAPSFTPYLLQVCNRKKKFLIIGTTGHSDTEKEGMLEASKSIPIVFTPNFSIGVNALFWLTRKTCEMLGSDFDLEVVEMHHHLKKDAPSGTARRLGEILAEVRKWEYEKQTRHGRQGIVGERTASEIGMHSIRGGDVVGDHTVIFAAIGERLELTHKASSRETFAKGALRAAKWASQQRPGLFNMQHVLGLE